MHLSTAIRFPAADDHTLKLRAIFNRTTEIIEQHLPDELAIEAQFFGKNVQSMLKLGRAQGVAIAAADDIDVVSVVVANALHREIVEALLVAPVRASGM